MALESFESPPWETRLLRLAHHALDHYADNEPIHNGREHLVQAYEHCATITKQHSRTFYLASGLLPRKQRRAARALYAFCRVSDDLVDKESSIYCNGGKKVWPTTHLFTIWWLWPGPTPGQTSTFPAATPSSFWMA